MAKGYELGLSLTSSFEFITVIKDKPALIPRGALALIYNSGELAGLEIRDETDSNGEPVACTVTMKRRGGFAYTARFSLDDARRAGLIKPDGAWQSYPANMLRWRAIGYCADVVFPDVLGGLKRADEFGAEIDLSGNVVDTTWQPVGPQQPPTTQPASAPDLRALVEQYTVQAVMGANGGKLPASDEELIAIAAKLGESDA